MLPYSDILKRAWTLTWGNKKLWWLGLFAYGLASGSSPGGGNYNYSFDADEWSSFPTELTGQTDLTGFFDEPILVAALVLLSIIFTLALAWWVVGKAARAGLVKLVDDAEEARPVEVAEGWRAGSRLWFRLFGIDVILFLPLLLVLGLGGLAVWGAVVAIAPADAADLFTRIMSVCGVAVFFVVFAVVLSAVLSLMRELADRHAVLDDLTFTESIGAAWRTLTTRLKDVFVMWLILVAVGLVYAIAIGILSVALFIPVALCIAVLGPFGILVALPAMGVLLVPGAAYNTFRSSVWTIFFRGLKGRYEAIPVVGAPWGAASAAEDGPLPPPPGPGSMEDA